MTATELDRRSVARNAKLAILHSLLAFFQTELDQVLAEQRDDDERIAVLLKAADAHTP